MQIRVGVIFGGMSEEYEVSLSSAAAVLAALEGEEYAVVRVGITRAGEWYVTEAGCGEIAADRWTAGAARAFFSPAPGEGLYLWNGGRPERVPLDLLFPVMHGACGEDGRMAALGALGGLPVVGCSTEAGALCMNKILAKQIAAAAGIPTLPHVALCAAAGVEENCRALEAALPYPVFCKPARGGSSIGAAVIRDHAAAAAHLAAAVGQADPLLLAEPYTPAREIEIALLEQEGVTEISPPGEILPPPHDFYSYAAKYEGGGARLSAPADLPAETARALREAAGVLFSAFGCRGLARMDFFLLPDGRFYFNECNTMPGFTPISMYPRLLTLGRSFPALLSCLIREALR